MSEVKFSDLFVRLHNDKSFRSRFAADPAAALAEAGFDPKALNLPAKIDPAELESRLERLFSGKQKLDAPSPEAAAKLSADELWTRYSVIRGTEAAELPVITAVVAYGGPPVTAVVVGRQPSQAARVELAKDLSKKGKP